MERICTDIDKNAENKFINVELISIIFIAIVIIIIEHYILIASENNPKFINLNHPANKLNSKTIEIIWIIILILKIYSWYRAKHNTNTIRKYISVDLLLLTSIIFGLFYVYMFFTIVNLRASLFILFFAFIFSLYYAYYMFRIDIISGIISVFLSIWLLYLLYSITLYIKLNPNVN